MPIKLTTAIEEGGKKNRKKFERIYRISKKTKIINAFLE